MLTSNPRRVAQDLRITAGNPLPERSTIRDAHPLAISARRYLATGTVMLALTVTWLGTVLWLAEALY